MCNHADVSLRVFASDVEYAKIAKYILHIGTIFRNVTLHMQL